MGAVVRLWATVGHVNDLVPLETLVPSGLLPLETLPGWPTVADPTLLQTLGLLAGIPLVVTLVIALLCFAPQLARAGRGEESTELETTSTDAAALESSAK